MKRTEDEKKKDREYLNSLLKDPRIRSMAGFVHHKHSNRLAHVLSVERLAVKWAYGFGKDYDYESLIRGALLHDYYPYDQNKKDERPKWHWLRHPDYALGQAEKDFTLNDTERDIIKNHMWPVTLFRAPHTKEGWLVNLADSVAAIHDFFKVGQKKRRKTINVTAGECLKEILSAGHPDEYFVPFNEAMADGKYESKIFSKDFIAERASSHKVSVKEYKQKMAGFLAFLAKPNRYEKLVMWFGDEPFCRANKEAVLLALKEYGYKGKIVSNTVNEETGDVLSSTEVSL